MILSERWGGETRKFICSDEVVRIFRAWMGGNEIPAGGGSGGFRAKPGSKMLLQIFVILGWNTTTSGIPFLAKQC